MSTAKGDQPFRQPPTDPARRSGLQQSISQIADRIQEIIDAAEREAEEIRAQAEAEAERYLEARRREAETLGGERALQLKRLLESIAEQVRRVRGESETMLQVVESAAAEIIDPAGSGGEDSSPLPPESAHVELSYGRRRRPNGDGTPQPLAETVETVPASSPGRSAANAERPVGYATREAQQAYGPAETLLRATQMAVAGSGRAEIEKALREDLGIDEPQAIVDRILGPREPTELHPEP